MKFHPLLYFPSLFVYYRQDAHEDLQSLDSCEYIWEAGVGAAHAPTPNPHHDAHRKELLKLLLTCCSQTIYLGEWCSTCTSGTV